MKKVKIRIKQITFLALAATVLSLLKPMTASAVPYASVDVGSDVTSAQDDTTAL